MNLVKVLQEKLIEEKRKMQTLEVKIREEVCKEMAEQLTGKMAVSVVLGHACN